LKKLTLRLNFGGVALGVAALIAQPALATVSGELDLGGTSSVTVGATQLQFTPMDMGFSTEVASTTALSFNGCSGTLGSSGCLTQNEGVDIFSGALVTAPIVFPVPDFITFQSHPGVTYTLDGFQIPTTTNGTSCGTTTAGESCTVFGGSPVSLESLGNGQVDAQLVAFGTVSDGVGPPSTFIGHFTALLSGTTPGDLQTKILGGGLVTTAYSGVITAASSVPEPRLISLLALAGALVAFIVQRKRKVQA
jgi:hypothetical protein